MEEISLYVKEMYVSKLLQDILQTFILTTNNVACSYYSDYYRLEFKR